MQRRDFFKKFLSWSGALSFATPFLFKGLVAGDKSRVVQSTDTKVLDSAGRVNADILLQMLDKGLQTLLSIDEITEAWQKIVRPGEVVGLKVNCLSGYGSTHPQLVQAIIQRLQGAGIRERDIIVWDRLSKDLEAGGFRVQDNRNRVRMIGNDILGFESELAIFGSAASRICRTVTRECDAIINLPLLKDHSIAGLTVALKNMFGAIHNPHKYHLSHGNPYIADVNMLPPIRQKIRLHICDALEAQYEGGPSFMPHWRWPMHSLLLSRDPVALDYSGWQIIDRKRKEMGLKTLKEVGREPTYIATAADAEHRLGTNDPMRIEVVRV